MNGFVELTVEARDIRAGDWTTYNGFRLVEDVRQLRDKRIGLVRAGGRLRADDKKDRDSPLKIYRREET